MCFNDSSERAINVGERDMVVGGGVKDAQSSSGCSSQQWRCGLVVGRGACPGTGDQKGLEMKMKMQEREHHCKSDIDMTPASLQAGSVVRLFQWQQR